MDSAEFKAALITITSHGIYDGVDLDEFWRYRKAVSAVVLSMTTPLPFNPSSNAAVREAIHTLLEVGVPVSDSQAPAYCLAVRTIFKAHVFVGAVEEGYLLTSTADTDDSDEESVSSMDEEEEEESKEPEEDEVAASTPDFVHHKAQLGFPTHTSVAGSDDIIQPPPVFESPSLLHSGAVTSYPFPAWHQYTASNFPMSAATQMDATILPVAVDLPSPSTYNPFEQGITHTLLDCFSSQDAYSTAASTMSSSSLASPSNWFTDYIHASAPKIAVSDEAAPMSSFGAFADALLPAPHSSAEQSQDDAAGGPGPSSSAEETENEVMNDTSLGRSAAALTDTPPSGKRASPDPSIMADLCLDNQGGVTARRVRIMLRAAANRSKCPKKKKAINKFLRHYHGAGGLDRIMADSSKWINYEIRRVYRDDTGHPETRSPPFRPYFLVIYLQNPDLPYFQEEQPALKWVANEGFAEDMTNDSDTDFDDDDDDEDDA
ncbi:hypothetical protein A4X13_0g5576 [Tilletia indica]|uniref:Uncharacterized protein n=1 Tax=Tilletia indica TaxID=43049 RepID=A0A177TNT4_9BASI|nr:hypothetical protein A4X13_0g5576 [Tilletia indica]